MPFPTSSPDFSMIFLKISEIFHDNVGGKYRAEGTTCNDPIQLGVWGRCKPPSGSWAGPWWGFRGKAPGNPENTAFWSTKNR